MTRIDNLVKLMKKSNHAILYIPADFIDSELIDSNLSIVLNTAINELIADEDLIVDKELVDGEYKITVSLTED